LVLEGGADGTTRQDDESDDDPRDPAEMTRWLNSNVARATMARHAPIVSRVTPGLAPLYRSL